MAVVRNIYKVLRSILFTACAAVIGIFVLLYIVLSIPAVNRQIKSVAEHEVANLIGSRLTVSNLTIMPFNEVRLQGVTLFTPDNQVCASIGRVGAGINIWKLITQGKVEIVYAEIIQMDARLWQNAEGEPLNIQFLIDAFKPKEKNKPPTKFDLKLHNIVIRKSSFQFDRKWKPAADSSEKIDFNHISVTDLRADIALPRLKNDDFIIDLRRLAMNEKSGLIIESLGLKTHISQQEIAVKDFNLRLPGTDLKIADFSLPVDGLSHIADAVKTGTHSLSISARPFSPADIAPFYPALRNFGGEYLLLLDVAGNLEEIELQSLTVREHTGNLELELEGSAGNLTSLERLSADIDRISLYASGNFLAKLMDILKLNEDVRTKLSAVGDVNVNAKGRVDLDARNAETLLELETDLGSIVADASGNWTSRESGNVDFKLKSESFDLGSLLKESKLGMLALETSGDVAITGKDIEGEVEALIPFIDYNSVRVENISLSGRKSGQEITGAVDVDDEVAELTANLQCLLQGADSQWHLDADVGRFLPSMLGLMTNQGNSSFSGSVTADITGNSVSTFAGNVTADDILFASDKKNLEVSSLVLTAETDGDRREYMLNSDVLWGRISGNFDPMKSVSALQNLISSVAPDFIPASKHDLSDYTGAGEFNFTVQPSESFYSGLGINFQPGVPIGISGVFNGGSDATLKIDAPYIIQGKNKLIKYTKVDIDIAEGRGVDVLLKTSYPVKKDYANLHFNAVGFQNSFDGQLAWTMENDSRNGGKLPLAVDLSRNQLTNAPEVNARIKQSNIAINGGKWTIDESDIEFADNVLEINNMRVWRGAQFIDIHGKASKDPMDILNVELAGIDLDYIFNTLNINYVDFGGIATGKVLVSGAFSSDPIAKTQTLFVKDLAYNGCVLGDGDLESHWDHPRKMVAINADITNKKDSSSATVRGGVFVTRDSLGFDFTANKIDVEFLQPFMSGFTSSVSGNATGEIKLYGTFSDIDLGGWAYADPVRLKVDYTNVYYAGSDTVFFSPGRISIPHVKIHDKYGNTALVKGLVTHNYLHDASFSFDMTDARHLLCYDTNQSQDTPWFGHVFADGSASIRGVPGLINLNINVNTAQGSKFTIVLDETQTATDYTFLTFSDKKKEAIVKEDIEVSFEDRYKKQIEQKMAEKPSIFNMDLAVGVNNGAEAVIVMDPKAGDKISAYGNGAFQMHYDTETDNFRIYGKYTLDRGTYNFSLQDLILKNFKIEPGSSISFNGDPMAGILDITAAYRVNTNLTDLDRSFMSDPDLNRTSVPVDALLKVTGDMNTPEINFDISLPTVTSDVERKVRSIISTDDMMSRQVIYLLALNRFYTPEFMGPSQGGELASVASSTLSSQLSNIIGQITDKVSVNPSFKSDRSDFSDMEVDVALSSSLFDNRLLLNGNFGYRDKSTSQTTFIGDFDLEYLLSKNGQLRLKAYNHFNDASYYLKSALTTQGVGIIYRKDFDDPLTWLKRLIKKGKQRKARKEQEKSERKPEKKD